MQLPQKFRSIPRAALELVWPFKTVPFKTRGPVLYTAQVDQSLNSGCLLDDLAEMVPFDKKQFP